MWGDLHCWWLDRMVRSDHPFMERMTLVWHSWFATSLDGTTTALMLRQNEMLRANALGNFHTLLREVTQDPAMLLWLDGASNSLYAPNENYGREMLELFTLGSGCGYDQDDVHQNARALTGWTCDWNEVGPYNFRFESDLHDPGVKTIFGQRGRFGWADSCRLAVTHPTHAPFLVEKLWAYFIADPIPGDTQRQLERAYTSSGFEIRPLVEAILRHPLFYTGERLVTPPAVFVAGLLKQRGRGLGTDNWSWICDQAGQLLFEPPNVSGWDYASWLDTARWAGRLQAVNYAIKADALNASTDSGYPADESAQDALTSALAYWGNPSLSAASTQNLLDYANQVAAAATQKWEQVPYRVLRQNGLRALIPMTPDFQTA